MSGTPAPIPTPASQSCSSMMAKAGERMPVACTPPPPLPPCFTNKAAPARRSVQEGHLRHAPAALRRAVRRAAARDVVPPPGVRRAERVRVRGPRAVDGVAVQQPPHVRRRGHTRAQCVDWAGAPWVVCVLRPVSRGLRLNLLFFLWALSYVSLLCVVVLYVPESRTCCVFALFGPLWAYGVRAGLRARRRADARRGSTVSVGRATVVHSLVLATACRRARDEKIAYTGPVSALFFHSPSGACGPLWGMPHSEWHPLRQEEESRASIDCADPNIV